MRHLGILVSLSLIAGCGSNGISNSDGSANEDMGVSSDLSGAGGDMPAPQCDPIAQNCASNEKCALVGGGMGTTSRPTCVPLGGTVTEGMTCMRSADLGTGAPDDCAAGLTCARASGGGGGGGGGTRVCRKICKADLNCGGTEACIASGSNTTYGVCIQPCTLFGTDCPNGGTCSTFSLGIASTMTNQIAIPSCRNPGTLAPFDDCSQGSCPANTYCDSNAVCSPLCDDGHLCPAMAPNDGGMISCQPLGSSVPNNGGICG